MLAKNALEKRTKAFGCNPVAFMLSPKPGFVLYGSNQALSDHYFFLFYWLQSCESPDLTTLVQLLHVVLFHLNKNTRPDQSPPVSKCATRPKTTLIRHSFNNIALVRLNQM